MTSRFDSPRDPILKILSDRGGKLEKSRLRRCVGIKYAQLNSLLDELAKEGKIGISGDVIYLIGH